MEQLIEGGEYTIGVLEDKALADVFISCRRANITTITRNIISDETQYICPGLDGS